MTNKTEEFYRSLFQELIVKANKIEKDLAPRIIITDFELAAVKASRAEFNEVRTQGCHFHLCQSILRKIQEKHLISRYNQDEEFSVNLRKLGALAFLPPEEIKDAFEVVSKNWLELS